MKIKKNHNEQNRKGKEKYIMGQDKKNKCLPTQIKCDPINFSRYKIQKFTKISDDINNGIKKEI